jgi:mRNA interferase MazF
MLFEYVATVLNWCIIKISLWEKSSSVLFKEGEIWWCRIGMNVGHETYGKGASFARPVLICKKLSSDFFVGVPLTSRKKEGNWFFPLEHNKKESCASLHQVRSFDGRCLVERICVLSDIQLQLAKKALHDLLCE